jgi:hypothetical protein
MGHLLMALERAVIIEHLVNMSTENVPRWLTGLEIHAAMYILICIYIREKPP